MSSWTKTWSEVKEEEEHKDQEKETEPKLSLYKLSLTTLESAHSAW